MAPSYTIREEPDGSHCICIEETALPCPGVALRLSTVIDCRPGEARMPPVTIDFLKTPPQQQCDAAAAAAQLAGHFTCCSNEFILFSQLRRVEAMVAAAGLPLDCAPGVNDFVKISLSGATNSFYKGVAITVEAGSPGSIVVDEEYEGEGDEVPPGADAGECAICYREYLVGGATSVTLPCGHTFHRRCIDRWTSVKRSCPYCRAFVLEENVYSDDEEEEEEEGDYDYDAEHDGGDLSRGEEYRSFQVPGGGTTSGDAVSGSAWLDGSFEEEEEVEDDGSDLSSYGYYGYGEEERRSGWLDGLTHVVGLGSWEI